jgi:ABC-type Na+ transport system ATPase subunit NatA
MSDKLNVTVDEAKRNVTLGFGVGALSRSVVIDLTDMKNVVDGLTEVVSMSHQHVEARISSLTKRLEMLERLSKDDLEYLSDLVRRHGREFRGDGRPTVDDELASKLAALANT